VGERRYDLSRRTLVLGIVNVTPDSFSDGGRYLDPAAAVAHGLRLVEEGADLLDVGGESTRPGASPVSPEEERGRITPVLRGLAREAGVPLSVDTRKPEVARAALDLGALVVNDVSGLRLRDAGGASLLARLAVPAKAAVIAMHMQGEPATMQVAPRYEDCVGEVTEWLAGAAESARRAGLPNERIVLDPGIGFGKTLEHNLSLLWGVDRLAALGHPVAIGVSRKSLFGALLGLPPEERLEAGLAATATAVLRGARLVRTHDVRATVRLLRTLEAILPDPRAGDELR
jgi:dihydropteroate synthase